MKLLPTQLTIKLLSETLAVSPQLHPSDMQEVARIGFKSVIINLPDFELGKEQPAAALIIDSAEKLGLQIIYQPVVTAHIQPDDVKKFGEIVTSLPKPVLAFCRSGNRCSILFQQWQANDDLESKS